MEKRITWNEFLEIAIKRGSTPALAEMNTGRFMDEVEEATGQWPNWTDEVPNEYLFFVS